MIDVLIAIFCAIPVIGFVFWIDCKYGKKQPNIFDYGSPIKVTLPPIESMRVGETITINNKNPRTITVVRHSDDGLDKNITRGFSIQELTRQRHLSDIHYAPWKRFVRFIAQRSSTPIKLILEQSDNASFEISEPSQTMADLTRKADLLIKRKRKQRSQK